jgi:soluble lytic murein transglycosylase-like protein
LFGCGIDRPDPTEHDDRMFKVVLYFLLALALASPLAHARKRERTPHAQTVMRSFDHCFETISGVSGVDSNILRAIALVESAGRPGATNRTHLKTTSSYDIGLMQINSRWLPTLSKWGISESELFEPCRSIEVGAWILVDLFARHTDQWQAIGAYNAACTSLDARQCRNARNRYINKVQSALQTVMNTPPSTSYRRVEPISMIQSIRFP